MKWFRFYHEALDDPKVQRLPADLYRAWVNLLCLASQSAPRGTLPPLTDIAFRLRLDEDQARVIVEALLEHELLDPVGANRWAPHNWQVRQPASDDVTARVTRYRQSKQQRSNDSETLPETLQRPLPKRERNGLDTERDSDTETEREREETAPDGAGVPRAVDQTPQEMASYDPRAFARLWTFYGRLGSPVAAAREWDRLRPSRELMIVLRDAIAAQREAFGWGQPGGQAQPYLSTWLSERRWEWEARPNKVEARKRR